MARRRFFVDAARNGQASIEGEEAKHLTRVLRVERGEKYEISDNAGGVYLAEVSLAHKGEVVFDVLEPVALKPASLRVTLFAALFKFDHFEWMVEKATELGVDRIVPVIAVRSERGLDQAAVKRVDRWRRIVMEASQQSRRDFLPEVELPVRLGEAVAGGGEAVRLLLDEESEAPMLGVLQGKDLDAVSMALGPEGGWTAEERAMFRAAGWESVSLGSRILRAETAGIAGLAVVAAAAAGAAAGKS